MRVLALQADHAGCGSARIETPYNALRTLGHDVTIADMLHSDAPQLYDVVVLQRPGNKWSIPIAEWCKEQNVPLVIELDDLCWALPDWNPFQEAWNGKAEGTDEVSWKIQQDTLKLAAAATVTTESLAEAIKPFQPNVYVLPNFIDISVYPDTQHNRTPVTIGWFGSHTHKKDLEIIAGLPGRASKQFPDIAVLTIGGYGPAEVALSHGVPEGQFRAISWLEDRENLNVALSLLDIGLAPLVQDPFNDSKSWIKVLEYGAVGVPTIASDIGPYHDFIKPDFGYLCSTRNEWKAALRDLLANPEKRLAMGKRAREVAEENSIQKNSWRWEKVLQEVVSKGSREYSPIVG